MENFNLYLLNSGYVQQQIIDKYISILWVDRYNEISTFELYSGSEYVDIKQGSILECSMSNKHMIVEDIYMNTNPTDDVMVTITGMSLESILDRRIVWEMTTMTGSLQDAIRKLLDAAIISPKIADRKIEKFRFVPSKDKRILDLKVDMQVTGATVYDVIQTLADMHNFGFSVTYNKAIDRIDFKLFMGTDRSTKAAGSGMVTYSPYLGNVLRSDVSKTYSNYKNVALVAGEGEGTSRKTHTVGSAKGMDRRELFVDARDISSSNGDTTISNDQYQKLLKTRGDAKLLDYLQKTEFNATVENTQQVILNRDVFLGDLVYMEDEYGNSGPTRMTEVIIANDTQNGFTMLPSFNRDEEKREDS